MKENELADAPRLVDAEECGRITGIAAKGTRNRLIREGRFPKPIPINGHRRLWVESELFDWVLTQIADRDAGRVPPIEAKMRVVRDQQAARMRNPGKNVEG